MTPAAALRALIARPTPPVIPLVMDPLSAKLAEAAGFEGLYLGGGTLGYTMVSTEAALPLPTMCHLATAIRAATPLPMILDGQCGWGDPMHMDYTIRLVEASGLAGIEIEDQLQPKRVHHHVGTEHLVPLDLMVEKIRVAVEARRDADFVIVARTNALRGPGGLDEALRRAEAYRAAGADMLLLLPRTPEDARAVGERVDAPLFYMTGGWDLPGIGMTPSELHDLGYRLIIDAITPFYARFRATRLAYEALAGWQVDPTFGGDFATETGILHDVIGLDRLLEIERRTVER
ncbi:methylisocitrate lyase [Rhodobacterales bacterium HKCCE2091]|nr:methylisocitrate lyase [Rhodobacterales bacterium HKCCE2091]